MREESERQRYVDPPEVRERPHRPGVEPSWEESWAVDFAAPDGSLGGFVRLALHPRAGVAWYWACLVGRRRPLVVVRDQDVARPRLGLELRGEGLWSAMHCETPDEHWSVALEAFAVAFDDAREACRGQRGDLVPFGLDLEWEAAGPVDHREGADGYDQAGDVHGEILLGQEAIDFEGTGHRVHAWGPVGWWSDSWWAADGCLDDGTRFHAVAPSPVTGPSTTLEGRGVVGPGSAVRFTVTTETDSEGFLGPAAVRLGSLAMSAVPVHLVPVPVEAPHRRAARLDRALCRFDAGDGRTGWGWMEWHRPCP